MWTQVSTSDPTTKIAIKSLNAKAEFEKESQNVWKRISAQHETSNVEHLRNNSQSRTTEHRTIELGSNLWLGFERTLDKEARRKLWDAWNAWRFTCETNYATRATMECHTRTIQRITYEASLCLEKYEIKILDTWIQIKVMEAWRGNKLMLFRI